MKLCMLYVYFIAHELLLFNHSYLAVLSVVLIIASMAFLFSFFFFFFFFFVPFKPMSVRALHRDLVMKPFESTSIGEQLCIPPIFCIFLGVHHICTFFLHEPLLRVPTMELSILISIFSLFCSKI